MSESLFGGAASVYQALSDSTKDLVDSVLADTVGGKVTVSSVGSGTLVVGTGGDGEVQGVLVGTNSAITGELKAGDLVITVALPASVALAFEGPPASVTPETAQAYFESVINEALPDTSTDAATVELRESLLAGIQALKDSLAPGTGGAAVNVTVKVITLSKVAQNGLLAQLPNAGSDVEFTGSTSTNELLAFVMSQLSADDRLVLKDVKAAQIVGAGKVALKDGSAAAAISGDSFNQSLTGGVGADTLVGGGGVDTLTGGGGSDIFGVNSISGDLLINDFDVKTDKIAFLFDGITSWQQVAPFLTSITESGGNSTLNFSTGASITLVGVSAQTLTIDLAKFSV